MFGVEEEIRRWLLRGNLEEVMPLYELTGEVDWRNSMSTGRNKEL
jgi:hypothetical protein